MALGTPLLGRTNAKSVNDGFDRWRKVLHISTVGLGLGLALLPSMAQNDSRSSATGASTSGLVSLGQQLFTSPLLSKDGSVSCSTCHIRAFGFSGGRPLAIGVGGYASGRRAPSLLGLGRATPLMWDGRASDLQHQVAMPLESPEMAISWPDALIRLQADPLISEILQRTQLPAIDRELCLNALAAYVESLAAGESRFDQYYYHHEPHALTEKELLGLRLFVHKARCSSCHLVSGIGAPFTDNAFHATGIGCVEGSCKDRGRAAITGNPADEGAFKTPGLRGVALRPYLMHDGSITSLEAAVEHYNQGIRSGQRGLDDRLGPLYLSRDEIDAIVAFLGALTPDDLAPAAGPAEVVQRRGIE